MLRRLAVVLVTALVFAAGARAAPVELMPGVTYDEGVQFTPHGPVALHVLTAPRPGDQNGLYQLAPVLARSALTGGVETLTQIEQDVSAQATVAGIDGDLFSGGDPHPSGVVMLGGLLEHPPLAGRSSIGIDQGGGLHVERVRFFGTWRGNGQRRPLNGLNQVPAPGQVALFTPAYGPQAPTVAGSAEVVLEPFPASQPNTDLQATVTAAGIGGGEPIPADGAVLMATGAVAAKLQAEAPLHSSLTARLILQPSWGGIVSALGGGPVLVRDGKPVFRSLEDFTNDQVTERDARAGIGQLADGRIILVAVDGRQPGYSVGLTSFELAQAMARLGAVTASALAPGPSVTVAFDGGLLNRPPAGAERPVKEALLVEYSGVYAPPPSVPLVNGDTGATAESLAYKIVRSSKVTAQLIGPDGAAHALEDGAQHDPGTYPFTFSSFDVEGDWRWHVTATDDLGRTSEIDRAFRYDTTLRALVAPRLARGGAAIGFTLSRAAQVRLRIETPQGIVVRSLPPAALAAGTQRLVWDGTLQGGTPAYDGTYVAHVFATSTVGTSDLRVAFAFRRGAAR